MHAGPVPVGRTPDAPAKAEDIRQLRFDTHQRPFLVLFELTRACDLACRHCRADAVPERDPAELSTTEVRAVLDDLASLGPPRPVVVFTGGDPLQRSDLEALVEHASGSGLTVAISPAGTPRATRARLAALCEAGASVVSFSLDGGSRQAHDSFRRVDGSFGWTLAGCRAAKELGLRLQVNTTVCAETVGDLPAVSRLVAELGASLWSVFFLVPTGRGRSLQGISAGQTEDVLAFLYELAAFVPLKTTEAPAFRRLVMLGPEGGTGHQPGALYHELHLRLEEAWPGRGEGSLPRAGAVAERPRGRRPPLAVGDGRGVVFVSHVGDVQPSGFLPLVVGNVREVPLSVIYSGSPLLRSLREPSLLKGRCGRCELKELCGGSRAQAFVRTGDPLGEDPTCSYEPAVLAPRAVVGE